MMLLCGLCLLLARVALAANVTISNGAIELTFDSTGSLVALFSQGTSFGAPSSSAARTNLAGCEPGAAQVRMDGSALCVARESICPGRAVVSVQDCFRPSSSANNTIVWATTVSSNSSTVWSVPITRGIDFELSQDSAVWAPWDSFPNQPEAPALLQPVPADELVGNSIWWLGGLLTTSGDNSTSAAYAFSGPKLSIPAVLAIEGDAAVLFWLSPDQFLSSELSLNLVVRMGMPITARFDCQRYRLGGGSSPIVLTAEVTSIQPDPRAALGFISSEQPTFFKPNVSTARTALSGTGWYSQCGPGVGGCDLQGSNHTFAAELDEIGFTQVWNNNFAEYYMGNHIPEVPATDYVFQSDAGINITVDALRARFIGFKHRGVTELPYFSLFEFGGGPPKYAMKCPTQPNDSSAEFAWTDPNHFLVNRSLEHAVLRSSSGECVYSPGWPGSFVMDPAHPAYLRMLLEQAHRHVHMLGDSFAGVSCDRGWPQLFNPFSDDGVSFCEHAKDGRCGSLLKSLREAAQVVADVFHSAGMVMSYNPIQIPRIDVMESFDGIFTELDVKTHANILLVAALSVQKPAVMWTTQVPADSTFAQLLLHGIFPMAPSPNGDHSLGLEGMDAYLRFGPMLRALRGREWVLTPNAIQATSSANATRVQSNLFRVTDGSLLAVVVPDVLGCEVVIGLANDLQHKSARVESLQVGRAEVWTPVDMSSGRVHVVLHGVVGMLRFSV